VEDGGHDAMVMVEQGVNFVKAKRLDESTEKGMPE